MRVPVLIAACAALGGCAGVGYVWDEYKGVEVTEVAMPEDTYRVFDKPAQSKMMITPSNAAAAAQGFGQGLLFNAIDGTPPKPRFEGAAAQYLQNTGRMGCRIIDAYVILKPQFEVKYDCTPLPAPAPAPPHRGARPKA